MRRPGAKALAVAVALMGASCATRASPEHAPLRFAWSPEPAAELRVAQASAPSMPSAPWAQALEPLTVYCANTGAESTLRLYGPTGALDTDAVEAFSQVSADSNGLAALNPRLVQLAYKAAHHFHAGRLVVVSGYRRMVRGKGGYHSSGDALDFKLPGVDYRRLAAYLRGFPRAGVGVYTNAATQYVHLDVRDRSYHWLDASPPGVTWREALLADKDEAKRDASYTPESDLPIEP